MLPVNNDYLIDFSTTPYRRVDHSSAFTSDSSEGLTADRVLVHVNTSVQPDLIN
jgi:hypothetical protein